MPARTQIAEPETSGLSQYVVVVGAVTIGTGVRKPNGREEVVRVNKGGLINAQADNASIQTLLAGKAIQPYVEGQSLRAPTLKAIVAAMGAEDDPVEQPAAEVQPMPAPASTS